MIALSLATDGRILCACKVLPNGIYSGMPIVELLPEGDISEYRYVNGKYIHDPLPVPEPEPTAQEDTEAMLIDHEYRLTLLELGLV